MEPTRLVLYHKNCADGFCAAWVYRRFRLAIPNEMPAEFVAVQYGEEPPDVRGRDVVILDFSYPRQKLIQMHEDAESLLVIDHHKTAKADLEGIPFCIFDMEKSGARITFDFVTPANPPYTPCPWLVDYTEDRDLWRWKLPSSREVNAAIRSYGFDFDTWDMLSRRNAVDLVAEGAAIIRDQAQTVAQAVQGARDICFDGYKGRVTNATTLISETAQELAKDRDFGCCWFELANGDKVYSLRSSDGGCDVSDICKKRGGGGHKHAAGFTAKNPEPEQGP